MHTDLGKKICWKCDEEVPSHQDFCPYCGTTLAGQSAGEDFEMEESLASLYKPPYSIKSSEPEPRQFSYQKELPRQKPARSSNRELWALLLLSFGGQMLALSLLILFFSEEGALTLQWKSSYWFLYALISAPLLWGGFRALKKFTI